MKNIFFIILFLNSFLLSTITAQNSTGINFFEKNGMRVDWRWQGETLCFKVFAPENGWVAIGFNTKSGLAKTNLIMGAVRGMSAEISDRYILRPGEHQAIERLGGNDLLKNKKGFEDKKGTTISFEMPSQPDDNFHTKIEKGKKYFVLLAYSMDDNFSHHSMMRIEVKVIF